MCSVSSMKKCCYGGHNCLVVTRMWGIKYVFALAVKYKVHLCLLLLCIKLLVSLKCCYVILFGTCPVCKCTLKDQSFTPGRFVVTELENH